LAVQSLGAGLASGLGLGLDRLGHGLRRKLVAEPWPELRCAGLCYELATKPKPELRGKGSATSLRPSLSPSPRLRQSPD